MPPVGFELTKQQASGRRPTPSSSLGPVANATDVPQPLRLIVLRPTPWTARPLGPAWALCMHVCMYICRFQNVVLRCPTHRLHCFLSSHWPSFRFLSYMAFLIPSIQFFFGLPRAVFCFGIHFSAILGNLPSAVLWTWPYRVSWFFSISFIIGSSNPICCLIVTFLILSFLDSLEELLRASISVASTRLLLFSVSLHVSEPYNKLLSINAL